VLTYPPSFTAVRADPGAVSAALGTSTSRYRAYLNVTPQQGPEQLESFAAFRLDVLDDDDYSIHEEGAIQSVRFFGGTGSCVTDDYITRVDHNHYREVACLVLGRRFGSVIVAAALANDWGRFETVLHRAVSAFTVN